MTKAVGIVGGMGPAATCDLMEKIVRATDAPDDQHHIRLYVDVNTGIPDRTDALEGRGPSPVPAIEESMRKLASIGAELLAMPCNTAHCFLNRIALPQGVPFVHMPNETARALAAEHVGCAAVLATDGTLESGLYTRALEDASVRPLYPTPDQQRLVMSVIYDYVKKGARTAGELPGTDVTQLVADLAARGAERIVLACTELPLAFSALGIEGCLDASDVLARAIVRAAGAPLRE